MIDYSIWITLKLFHTFWSTLFIKATAKVQKITITKEKNTGFMRKNAFKMEEILEWNLISLIVVPLDKICGLN